jgi:hypothetical protein
MTARTKIASALDALGRRLWDARVTSTTDSDIIREAVRALLTSQPEDVGEVITALGRMIAMAEVEVDTRRCSRLSLRILNDARAVLARHPTKEAENG